jgi:hypothetical protein
MADIIESSETARVGLAQDNSRDNSHSREGDLTSDALGVPLLSDDAAPLSNALHIPTLIRERPDAEAAANDGRERWSQETAKKPSAFELLFGVSSRPVVRASGSAFSSRATSETSEFDQFGRIRSSDSLTPQNFNRETVPAGQPREDAGSFVWAPSHRQRTAISGRLEKLDKVALALGALIVIGPLFAAMVGRSMS